jgi:hypothetical protein
VTLDRVINLVERDDNLGLCTFCGQEASNVEPDARGYKCESCEENKVYGAQELLFMLEG